jgi:hypothetical protein
LQLYFDMLLFEWLDVHPLNMFLKFSELHRFSLLIVYSYIFRIFTTGS